MEYIQRSQRGLSTLPCQKGILPTTMYWHYAFLSTKGNNLACKRTSLFSMIFGQSNSMANQRKQDEYYTIGLQQLQNLASNDAKNVVDCHEKNECHKNNHADLVNHALYCRSGFLTEFISYHKC